MAEGRLANLNRQLADGGSIEARMDELEATFSAAAGTELGGDAAPLNTELAPASEPAIDPDLQPPAASETAPEAVE